MQQDRFYCLILVNELFELTKHDRVILNNSLILRKAEKDDLSLIKHHIDLMNSKSNSKLWKNYFENEVIPDKSLFYSELVKFTPSKWRYTILEYDKFQLAQEIVQALRLSELKITPLIQYSFEITGGFELKETGDTLITRDDVAVFNILTDTSVKYEKYGTSRFVRKKPDNESILNFNEVYANICKLTDSGNDNYQFIIKALYDFVDINIISNKSPFKLLSYFSIIESLLTYQPKNNSDTIISRQLVQKINLLYNNFMDKFSFKDYFKGSNTNTIETIINKLYTYRNDIAHGNMSRLTKELKIVHDNYDNVLPFIDELLRKILNVAISKPNLLLDIKKC